MSLYSQHYQAIETINTQLASWIAQYYNRYPHFRSISQDITNMIMLYNDGIKNIVTLKRVKHH